MKIGEVWKYKTWLIKLLNDNIHLYTDDYEPNSESTRVEIVEIDGENIWFREVSLWKNRHAIHRQTFIQIFEKDYKKV